MTAEASRAELTGDAIVAAARTWIGTPYEHQASCRGAGTDCLGLLRGRVSRLREQPGMRVPHMGWNALRPRSGSNLLAGVADGARAYFVHSYAAPVTEDCVAACRHGDEFAAVVQRGHVMGAQFHPERSAAVGARLLANFLA